MEPSRVTDCPLRSSSLEFQEAGDDMLVHDVTLRKIHVLNRTAAQVLQACDGKTTVLQIAHRIAPDCVAQATADIAGIVEEFRRLGLLSA
jgi:Coenzyme PQQ synthesis protein D (PqqD)